MRRPYPGYQPFPCVRYAGSPGGGRITGLRRVGSNRRAGGSRICRAKRTAAGRVRPDRRARVHSPQPSHAGRGGRWRERGQSTLEHESTCRLCHRPLWERLARGKPHQQPPYRRSALAAAPGALRECAGVQGAQHHAARSQPHLQEAGRGGRVCPGKWARSCGR